MIKRVGYGLSSCLVAITRDGIPLDTVLYIVASTAYRSRAEMVEKLAPTLPGPDASEMLANAVTLWDTGRIFQPSVRPAGRRPSTALWRTATAEEVAMDAGGDAGEETPPADAEVIRMPSYAAGTPGIGAFYGHSGIGKSATLAATPAGTAPASEFAAITGEAALARETAPPFSGLVLTPQQEAALAAMLSGRSSTIRGAPGSGRTLVAALAAHRWDLVARGHDAGNALLVVAGDAERRRVREFLRSTVTTYAEIEAMLRTGIDQITLGHGLVILDDYTPEIAAMLDPELSGLPSLPVMRIMREEEATMQADADLSTAIRQS